MRYSIFPLDTAFLWAGLLCSPRPCPPRGPSPGEPLHPGPQRHSSQVGPQRQLGPRGLAPSALPPGLAGCRWEGLHGRLPGPRADLRALLLPLPQQPGRLPDVSEPRPDPAQLTSPVVPLLPWPPCPRPCQQWGHAVLSSESGRIQKGPSGQVSTAQLPTLGKASAPNHQGKLPAQSLTSSSLPQPLPSLSGHLLGPGHRSCPRFPLMGEPGPPTLLPTLLSHRRGGKELQPSVCPGAS